MGKIYLKVLPLGALVVLLTLPFLPFQQTFAQVEEPPVLQQDGDTQLIDDLSLTFVPVDDLDNPQAIELIKQSVDEDSVPLKSVTVFTPSDKDQISDTSPKDPAAEKALDLAKKLHPEAAPLVVESKALQTIAQQDKFYHPYNLLLVLIRFGGVFALGKQLAILSGVPLALAGKDALMPGSLAGAQTVLFSPLRLWGSHHGFVKPDKTVKAGPVEAFFKDAILTGIFLSASHLWDVHMGITAFNPLRPLGALAAGVATDSSYYVTIRNRASYYIEKYPEKAVMINRVARTAEVVVSIVTSLAQLALLRASTEHHGLALSLAANAAIGIVGGITYGLACHGKACKMGAKKAVEKVRSALCKMMLIGARPLKPQLP